jgi:hypothetical protein
MINIQEEVFKVWVNGILIIFIHFERNCRYCETYCGVPENFSAPIYHVRASHLPATGSHKATFMEFLRNQIKPLFQTVSQIDVKVMRFEKEVPENSLFGTSGQWKINMLRNTHSAMLW